MKLLAGGPHWLEGQGLVGALQAKSGSREDLSSSTSPKPGPLLLLWLCPLKLRTLYALGQQHRGLGSGQLSPVFSRVAVLWSRCLPW